MDDNSTETADPTPSTEELSLSERVINLTASSRDLMTHHVVQIEKRFGDPARPVAKALPATSSPVPASNALPTAEEINTAFSNAGAIFPPYDPETLVMLFEHSNALRSNVDSYKTNIESFGARFEPTIDLNAPDSDQKIGDAMFLEELHRDGDSLVPQAAYPQPDAIANKRKEITHAMRLEKARLDNFLEGCVPESSLVCLREQSRVDEEVTGNAYWEVIRNAKGDVAQFTYLPAHSIRLLPIETFPIEVRALQRVSALSSEPTTKVRRFRAFVQVVYNRVVYFREYGDPRTMNALTGARYPSLEAMREVDPDAIEAHEIAHFKIHSSRTPYGVPRWIGNLLAVLGSRAAEEVNYLYFDNKAIPPVALLVSGGRLADGSKQKIESFIKDHIKGRENFHKIMIVEAVGPNSAQTPGMPDAGRVRLEIVKLNDAQQKDALFQTYDERNIDKIGSSFRLPRLVRGDVRDFNRATADASLDFAEMQVFQPERNKRDEFMNRQILPEMGVRFWKFVSNTPVSKDPTALTENICKLSERGILSIKEGRAFARDVFNVELTPIGDWGELPLALILAGMAPPQESVAETANPPLPTAESDKPAPAQDRNLAAVAAHLAQLRDKLQGAAKVAADRTAKEERRAYDAGQIYTIPVAKAQIEEWIEADEPAAE